ncbi:AlpA family transcriptional regulator [Phycicoccus sp. Soil748]|uniref:helix-turn-helix transcriptional regulator n=1 Tax=Phycicoccus sp. Soil748 TaxID=1736397 RepID=UPI0009EB8B94|nr:helix-turn-helix domain-containing protein [Phycicoccus sp. Soil748]
MRRQRTTDEPPRPTSSKVVAIEPLWTIHDVSKYLGVPVGTLYQWRHRGMGPPAVRLGKHLRYQPAAVRTWVTEQVA